MAAKRLFVVHPGRATRRRVTSLTSDERKRIVSMFDLTGGDYDRVADRAGIIGLQRADVLAVVLIATRKPMGTAAPLELVTRRAG